MAPISATSATATKVGAGNNSSMDGFELLTTRIDGIETRTFAGMPRSLGDVYRSLGAYDDRVLIVSEQGRLTYGETLRKAAALASFLTSRGLAREGDRIAIAMHNCPQWTIAFIAITALGASAVLINNRSTSHEIAAALADTEPTAIIADAPCARRINRVGCKPAMALIVTHDTAACPAADAISFDEAIADWERATLDPVARAPEDEAVVMFTSGTTGTAKGVLLSHRGVLTGLMNIQYSMNIIGARARSERGASPLPAPQPAALLAVPLFHTSGCYSIFLSNLIRGGRIVMLRKWHPQRAIELIAQERIAAFSGPPSMLWDLVHARREGLDLDSLLSIGVAGQELRPALLRAIATAFPHAIIGRGYGMTEANGSVCLIAGDELLCRPTSSGRVIATADIKLVDEAGEEVRPGSAGEICLRGAMLMQGYCKRPEDTTTALRDGWLYTGDIGRLDEDGHLHIIDRKKDIIISGGDKISCSEVERAALEHPAVADAAAFGVADRRLGEVVAIAIMLKPDCLVDSFALKNHVAVQLAIYKVPRLIMYCSTLPRTTLGKINRQELRNRFMALHPRYRSHDNEPGAAPTPDGGTTVPQDELCDGNERMVPPEQPAGAEQFEQIAADPSTAGT